MIETHRWADLPWGPPLPSYSVSSGDGPRRSGDHSASGEKWARIHCRGRYPNSALSIMVNRNHQGKDNKLLFPDDGDKPKKRGDAVASRQRLGDLLNDYGTHRMNTLTLHR
jgi:hypothetical protein